MRWLSFCRILCCLLVLVLLLGCSSRERRKYERMSAEEQAQAYLALSESEQQEVWDNLTDSQRAKLSEGLDKVRNPAPEPSEEPPAPPQPPVEEPKPPAPQPSPVVTRQPQPPVPVPSPVATAEPPAPSPSPRPADPPTATPTTPAPPPPPPAPPVEGPVASTPELTPAEFLDRLFGGSGDTHSRLYIPGYGYFQGAIGSDGNVTVAGHVRVIGGVSGRAGRLQDGAMVTTNPDYLDNMQPGRSRFRIVEWKEIN